MSCMHHLFQETSSCIQAFSARGKVDCDSSSMMQEEWCICEDWALNNCLSGGGRKPALGNIEDLLADEIFKIWILTNKVTKTFICDCARQWPKSMNEFDYNWKLLHWDDFDCNWKLLHFDSQMPWILLRQIIHLTKSTNEQLVQRAVDYMKLATDQEAAYQSRMNITDGWNNSLFWGC